MPRAGVLVWGGNRNGRRVKGATCRNASILRTESLNLQISKFPFSQMSTPSPTPQRGFSAGCIMFVIFAVWFVGFGAYMFYKMRQQVVDMRSFMETEQMAIPAAQPTAEEITGLHGKLAAFAAEVKAQRPATLELMPADLNVLIATEDKLQPFRTVIRFDRVDQHLTAQVSEAHNGVPLTGERLFLNGEMDFSLRKDSKTGVVLQVEAIRPRGGKMVTEGYFKAYAAAQYFDKQLLDPMREKPEVSETLRRLTTVRLANGRIIAEFSPAGPPQPPGETAPRP